MDNTLKESVQDWSVLHFYGKLKRFGPSNLSSFVASLDTYNVVKHLGAALETIPRMFYVENEKGKTLK